MRDGNKTKKQLIGELAGLRKRVAEWESRGSLLGSAAGARTASESGAHEQLAELEHLYRTAPVGLAFLDAKLRYRRINEKLAAMNGASVEAHIGRTVGDMIPGIADRVTAIHRKVLRAGKPVLNVQVSGVVPSDLGEEHTRLASVSQVSMRWAAFGMLTVAVNIGLLQGQQLSTTLEGVITDSATGQPISGASINVVGVDIEDRTGASGAFRLSGFGRAPLH